MVETVRLLEESKEKCKLWEENLPLLPVQLDEANGANGVLENELVFLEREIITMEIWNIDDRTRLADDAQVKAGNRILRNDVIEKEISKYCMNQKSLRKRLRKSKCF